MKKYSIKITDPKTPIKCANEMAPYRRGEKELTPEICKDWLRMGNNIKILSDILDLVIKKLEKNPREYPKYREVLFGIISEREQPDRITGKVINAAKFVSQNKAERIDKFLIYTLKRQNLSDEKKAEVAKLSDELEEVLPTNIDELAAEFTQYAVECQKQDSNTVAAELAERAIVELDNMKRKEEKRRKEQGVLGRIFRRKSR